MKYSILIPCTAMDPSTEESIRNIYNYFEHLVSANFEVVVIINNRVHDDAYNKSLERGNSLHTQLSNLKFISLPYGIFGKGAALKSGYSNSSGDIILFSDSDLPYNLNFFKEALIQIDLGYHIVLANRRLKDSTTIYPIELSNWVLKRKRLSYLFNLTIRTLFPISHTDTQAGIRAMTRSFADVAFRLQTCSGFLFDLEHLLAQKNNNFLCKSLPVELNIKNEQSTVRLFHEALRTAFWISLIFARNFLGYYSVKNHVRSFFKNSTYMQRLFVLLRINQTPYLEISRYLPEQGNILDMGCGHGLLSMTMALTKPQAQILSLDHDSARLKKIAIATQEIKNIAFKQADLTDWQSQKEQFSGIALIDVLHYLNPQEQKILIEKTFSSLSENGTLIMREVEKSNNSKSHINRLYERLSTWIGFTATKNKSSFFQSTSDWIDILEKTGFSVRIKKCPSILFSDVLFIATKTTDTIHPPIQQINCISADDWGMSPAINRGILHLAQKGIIQKVSIMAYAPHLEYLLDELKSVPNLNLSLHFQLTNTTLWNSPSMLLLRSTFAFFNKRKWNSWIDREFTEQLTILRSKNINITSFDGHHHVHIFPNIAPRVALSAKKNNLYNTRLPMDKTTIRTGKSPIYFSAKMAQKHFETSNFQYSPFFYPQKKHFETYSSFRETLYSLENHEILVHPSESNDFLQFKIDDPYSDARVHEYNVLNNFTDHLSRHSEGNFPRA